VSSQGALLEAPTVESSYEEIHGSFGSLFLKIFSKKCWEYVVLLYNLQCR